LELRYKNKKIRSLCEKQAEAVKKLGADCAKKLRTRLADLEAANRVTELIAGNPHPLIGDRSGQFAVSLQGGWRLVFAPSNDPHPTKPDGGIDWEQVTIVTIEYIGDYHD
jgi:proteic killer suppression protein